MCFETFEEFEEVLLVLVLLFDLISDYRNDILRLLVPLVVPLRLQVELEGGGELAFERCSNIFKVVDDRCKLIPTLKMLRESVLDLECLIELLECFSVL